MKMKKIIFLILAVLCCGELSAQLAVSMEIAQYNYLAFEPVFVRLSVKNFSAHAVAFGNNERMKGTLKFEIEPEGKTNKKMIPPINPGNLPPLTGSIILPGATQEYTFNLTEYYDLSQPGRYSIRAVIRHGLFTDEYISADRYITITRGVTLWKQTVGVPTLGGVKNDDSEKKVKQRNYSIVSYNTGKVQVLNLLIDDKNLVYANRRIAFDLGPEFKPQCQIDFLSRLHIIVAASNRVFAYYTFNLDGKLDDRKILLKTSATPKLVTDPKNGYVTVIGGREAIPDQDYEDIRDLPFLGIGRNGTAGTIQPGVNRDQELNAIPD